MTAFRDYLLEDRRLVMLRLLSEMPAYKTNSSVMVAALDSVGHGVSRDQVKTEMQWLAEQGLLTCEQAGPVLVATLTERGEDVAKGRSVVPGIKKPGA